MCSRFNSTCRKVLILLVGGAPLATFATCVPTGDGGGAFFFTSSGNVIEDTLDELEDIFDD